MLELYRGVLRLSTETSITQQLNEISKLCFEFHDLLIT